MTPCHVRGWRSMTSPSAALPRGTNEYPLRSVFPYHTADFRGTQDPLSCSRMALHDIPLSYAPEGDKQMCVTLCFLLSRIRLLGNAGYEATKCGCVIRIVLTERGVVSPPLKRSKGGTSSRLSAADDKGVVPSQSASLTALPEGEPRHLRRIPSSVSFADTFPTGGKARDVLPSFIRSCSYFATTEQSYFNLSAG